MVKFDNDKNFKTNVIYHHVNISVIDVLALLEILQRHKCRCKSFKYQTEIIQ